MENYRSSDTDILHTNPRVPSGLEVESATLHVPTYVHGQNTLLPPDAHMISSSPSWKAKLTDTVSGLGERVSDMKTVAMDRLSDAKSMGMQKADELKQQVNASIDRMKPVVAEKVQTLKDTARVQSTKLQAQMKTDAVKWAGIAAGVSFGLGMLGRMVRRHYVKYHGNQPQIIVISGAC